MLKTYQNIDWTYPKNYNMNNNIHPSRHHSFYDDSIIPYEFIDQLIQTFFHSGTDYDS